MGKAGLFTECKSKKKAYLLHTIRLPGTGQVWARVPTNHIEPSGSSFMNSNTGLNDLLPSEFYLSQNYPNPFSEKTTIKLCVAYKTKVKLEVFDSAGELVKTLLNEEKEPGTYEIEFDVSIFPAGGLGPSKGMYVYKLQAGDFSATKRMLLLKQETLS